MIIYVIAVVISGFIVGGLARAVVPGKQPMSPGATIGLGVLGSIAGGIVGRIIFGSGGARFFGLILAVAAAAGLLVLAIKKGWVRTVTSS